MSDMNSPACERAEGATGRKSVLFITPRFGTVHRGVEVFVEEICRRLDKREFSITILSAHHDCAIPDVDFQKRRTVPREKLGWMQRSGLARFFLRTPWFRGPAEWEALFLMLHSVPALWRRRFDIVVPQGGSWTYLFASMLFPRATRIVSIGHAGPVKGDLRRSHLFVALTPAAEKAALEMCPGIKTVVIPNGVDCGKFTPRPRVRKDGPKTILTVGALLHDKRHDLLLDAVGLLDGTIRLVIVGDGPEKARLMRHPLYRAGRVDFRQYTHEQMPACYNEADVFTLASPDEAFGIVFLEAMASGMNVVAHDGVRQRFVLGDAGIFCNVNDGKAYASALQRALSLKNAKASIVRASLFDWEKITARYEMAFSSI